jgi:hypothetical protein
MLGSSLRYHPEIEIKRRQTHCIYELLPENSIATFEVFVSDAENDSELSALVQIEGPVAPSDINADSSEIQTNRNNGMGAQLQRKIEQWPSFLAGHRHNFQLIGMIHHAFNVDFTDAGVVDGYINSPRRRAEQRKIEEEIQRRESGGEIYEESNKIERVEPDSFEPYEWTKAIKTGGWYRMCVQAGEFGVVVELDIRSSDKLGGVDHETGHVYTHEKREELDEARRISEAFAIAKEAEENKLTEEQLRQEIESAVKDYDLESTTKLMSEINSLVTQLQAHLGAMMKRSKGHEMQAKRNYRRIARSGLIETVLYLVSLKGFAAMV